MSAIHARSPYYVTVVEATYTHVELELFVYEGTQTTDQATGVSYTLTARVTGGRVDIDISPYIRDYLSDLLTGAYGSHTASSVWVDFRTRRHSGGTPSAWYPASGYTEMYAFLGYGYHREGKQRFYAGAASYYNPEDTLGSDVLITPGTTIYIPDGETARIPIDCMESTTTGNRNSYFFVKGGGSPDDFQPASMTATPTESDNLIQVFSDDGLYEYNAIAYQNAGDVVTHDIVRVTPERHTPKEVIFRNKYGALQQMWFFGRTDHSMSTKSNQYKRGLQEAGVINEERHKYVKFDVQGRERITLNSGWQVEANNELFRQLLLSEEIYLRMTDYGDDTERIFPLNVSTSDMQYKTKIDDKLINYTITFDVAADKII